MRLVFKLPRESETLEDLLNDVERRFLLEDPAIGVARQEPEPRDNVGLVVCKAVVSSGLNEAADESVDITIVTVSGMNRDGDALAHDVGESDRAVLRQQIEMKGKEPRDPLLSGEFLEQENIVAQGRLDGDDAGFLGVVRHERSFEIAWATAPCRSRLGTESESRFA